MIKLVELVRGSLGEIKYKRMFREKRETSKEEDTRVREINFLEEICDLWEIDHQTNWRHDSQEICSITWTVQPDCIVIIADHTCTEIEANYRHEFRDRIFYI